MARPHRLLAVVVLLLTAGAAAGPPRAGETPREVVDGLPAFATLAPAGAPRFVLRGTQATARAAQLAAVAKAVQADVARRFLSGAELSGRAPVDVCLFETAADYAAFSSRLLGGRPPPSDLGFFDPGLRVVVANVGRSIGNLRHELAHAVLNDDWPQVPSWLTEGVGSLYGTAALEADGTFRFLVNYRLAHLLAAKRDGTLPDLPQLAAATPDEVYGPRVMAFYGLARYLLLYLDGRGALGAFLTEYRRAASTKARREALERHVDWAGFLRWADGLGAAAARPKRR